jgi:hypothetical protein
MSARSKQRYAAGLGAAALTAGLALTAVTAVTAPAAQAAPVSAAVSDGGVWLARQLTNGVVHNDQYGFDDYGTSVDIALALHAIATSPTDHASDITDIENALAANLASYTTNTGGGYPSEKYAGSVAKAAYLLQQTGGDPTSFGGTNLVTELEGLTDDSTGAIHDTVDPSDPWGADYENTIGQAFAVAALRTAGSTEAAKATDWLLAQQCPGGGFSLNLNQGAASCASNADADPDATSYVLVVLGAAADSDARIARAVGKAEAWLMARQNADGSFDGGASTDYPNANSTGLAGWALGQLGDTGAARAAATWLRQHQVQPLSACPSQLSTEAGAIAYDDAALAAGRTDGITTGTRGQWRSASSQAVPALQWAPTGQSAPVLTAPTTYVRAGGTATVRATGVTPGTWVCGSVGTSHVPGAAGADGSARLTVKVPAGTGNRTVTLTTSDDATATATLKALAAKRLTLTLAKATVKHGAKETVRTSGLAAGEPVKVVYNGRVIKTAKATTTGTYALTFAVGTATGTRTVKIQGAFADRIGSKSFKVS